MLYRMVNTSDRLPSDDSYYITDDGEAQCINGKWYWENDLLSFQINWWLEPVTVISDKQIDDIKDKMLAGFVLSSLEQDALIAGFYYGIKCSIEQLIKSNNETI